MSAQKAPLVALATYRKLPELAPGDRETALHLRAQGIEAVPVFWDDATVRWADFAAVVVRSTWDYHLRLPEFLGWVRQLEALAVPLWNPPVLLRWNSDKHYLQELAARGIPLPQTRWLSAGTEADFNAVWQALGRQPVVIKPTVGATAYLTEFLPDQHTGQIALAQILQHSGAMVQQYLPELAENGEWSFIFLDGRFSHAVLKQARDGFRVQNDFGGIARAAHAPAGFIAQAEAVLAQIRPEWLYARVDMVEVRGRLVLMELELVEPELFLPYAEGATARFAAAIRARLQKAPHPQA